MQKTAECNHLLLRLQAGVDIDFALCRKNQHRSSYFVEFVCLLYFCDIRSPLPSRGDLDFGSVMVVVCLIPCDIITFEPFGILLSNLNHILIT